MATGAWGALSASLVQPEAQGDIVPQARTSGRRNTVPLPGVLARPDPGPISPEFSEKRLLSGIRSKATRFGHGKTFSFKTITRRYARGGG